MLSDITRGSVEVRPSALLSPVKQKRRISSLKLAIRGNLLHVGDGRQSESEPGTVHNARTKYNHAWLDCSGGPLRAPKLWMSGV